MRGVDRADFNFDLRPRSGIIPRRVVKIPRGPAARIDSPFPPAVYSRRSNFAPASSQRGPPL